MKKLKYFIPFFLLWYFLNGLILTYVFKKSDIYNENDPTYKACVYEDEHDNRTSFEKCGGDICPGPWCFPPNVSNSGFFLHPDTYEYTFKWPVWVINDYVWPEVYDWNTRTYSRKFLYKAFI